MNYLTLRRHISEINKEIRNNPSLVTRVCKTSGNATGLILKQKKIFCCLTIQPETNNQGFWLTNEWEELDSESHTIKAFNRNIINGKLLSLSLLGDEAKGQFDRVLDISIKVTDRFFGGDKYWHLICEFTGRVSNIILCDDAYIVTEMLKRTNNNSVGSEYQLPDSLQLINPFTCKLTELDEAFSSPEETWIDRIGGISPNIKREILHRKNNHLSDSISEIFADIISDYESEGPVYAYSLEGKLKAISAVNLTYLQVKFDGILFDSVNEAILWAENKLFKERRLTQIKKQVTGKYKKNLKFRLKQISEQDALMKKYENFEHYQKLGNLILSNIQEIKLRSKSVILKDWETGEDLRIELDPHKTPAQNAQKYFHLCKKAKRGIELVKVRTEKLKSEIQWLEEQIWLAENSDNEADLQVAEQKKLKTKRISKNSSKKQQQGKRFTKIKPLLEINDCRYYVGKNGKQNDIVTFKMGKKGDRWFHANDVPGAHVVLKKQNGEISEKDLYIGALLAAKFSFAKNSSKVAVDTTDVCNVKRIPKGGPGQVSYTGQNTIFVNPTEPIEPDDKV